MISHAIIMTAILTGKIAKNVREQVWNVAFLTLPYAKATRSGRAVLCQSMNVHPEGIMQPNAQSHMIRTVNECMLCPH